MSNLRPILTTIFLTIFLVACGTTPKTPECPGPATSPTTSPTPQPAEPAAPAPPADEARIKQLIAGLGDWNRGRDNAEALVEIGPPAVDALIAALKNPNDGVRGNAARALGEIKAPEAVEPLGGMVGDSKYWVARNAVYALNNIGTPATLAFIRQALQHHDGRVQETTLWVLEERGDREAIPEISELMVAASDQYVRWRAMKALRTLKPGEEIAALTRTLNDETAEIDRRRNAAVMLGSLQAEEAVPSLVKALQAEDAGIRWRAAEALGEIGAQSARPAIEAQLSDPNGEVRIFAVGALGILGSALSVDPLKAMLSQPGSELRMNTIRSLKKIGGVEAAGAIRGALSNSDAYLLVMVIDTLAEMGTAGAAEEIKAKAANSSPAVRAAVMRAMGALAPPDAADLLEKGRADADFWVREAAAAAEKRLAGKK